MATHETQLPVMKESRFTVFAILSRRWILATMIVILAMGVIIRLGVWQLERLQQRRAFNERYLQQINQPLITLDETTLNQDLFNLEYRHVNVTGEFDFDGEVAIRNQVYGNEWGVYLLTPLKITGTDKIIFVNRGWIPGDDYLSGDWSAYRQLGVVQIYGILRRSQEKADFGKRNDPIPKPGDPPIKSWNFINIKGISKQVKGSVVPNVYVQMIEAPSGIFLPIPAQVEVEISEGPHMSYAIQWFLFATILGIGYPFYVKRKGM